jgi:molybdenum cofactor cytidylyltransferase
VCSWNFVKTAQAEAYATKPQRIFLLAAIIVSAGASSRMGRPKALLPYRESTFLEHLIEITHHPRVGVIRVVLGAGAENIRTAAKINPSMVVVNPNWEQGQLSSICAGIKSLDGMDTAGLILCPVDHPLVTADLVSNLIAQFFLNHKLIVVPTFNGRRGHPVIFSSSLYSELLDAPPAKGARAVVWAHAADVLEVPTTEEGVVLNINDPDMLQRATGNTA